jgi:hypothetical protein
MRGLHDGVAVIAITPVIDVMVRGIGARPVLPERYNTPMPVLRIGNEESRRFYLNPDRLAAYFGLA